MSLKPRVTSNAVLSPLRSSRALVATVVPILIHSTTSRQTRFPDRRRDWDSCIQLTYITEIQLSSSRDRGPVECFQDQPDGLRGRVIVVVWVDGKDFDNDVLMAVGLGNAVGECPTTVYRDTKWSVAPYSCRHAEDCCFWIGSD